MSELNYSNIIKKIYEKRDDIKERIDSNREKFFLANRNMFKNKLFINWIFFTICYFGLFLFGGVLEKITNISSILSMLPNCSVPLSMIGVSLVGGPLISN